MSFDFFIKTSIAYLISSSFFAEEEKPFSNGLGDRSKARSLILAGWDEPVNRYFRFSLRQYVWFSFVLSLYGVTQETSKL